MEPSERTEALTRKLSAKLRVRGDTLADVAANAGRKLPRRIETDLKTMIEAESMARNPKLAHRIDQRRVRRSERKLNRFLDKLDPAAERRGEVLDGIAKIAFVFVVVVLSVFFTLIWRGYFD
jgi:hypothetical protein